MCRGKKVANIAWFMIGMAVIMFGLGAGDPHIHLQVPDSPAQLYSSPGSRQPW